MAKLNILLLQPFDGSSIEASIDPLWSADYVINESIKCKFITPINPQRERYRLVYKETYTEFWGETTFEEIGVKDNTSVAIVISPFA